MKNIIIIVLGVFYMSSAHAGLGDILSNIFSSDRNDCVVDTTKLNSTQSAIAEVSAVMSRKTYDDKNCSQQFPSYFQIIIEAATRDPGSHNYTAIGEFVAQQVRLGNISRLEGGNLIKTYFDKELVSLSNLKKVQMSSVACDSDSVQEGSHLKPEIAEEANRELQKKEMGMLNVLDDPTAYRKAQDHYDMMLVLLEGGCLSSGRVR